MRRPSLRLFALAALTAGVIAAEPVRPWPPIRGELSGQFALPQIPGFPPLAWRIEAQPLSGAGLVLSATATSPGLSLRVELTPPAGDAPGTWRIGEAKIDAASWWRLTIDQAGIKYEAKGDGSTIMVERDKVAATRLLISGKGLVTSGSVGYEIFDNTSVMGQTDFVQRLNQQRALEGELSRTIREWDRVQSVRVHLALPKRQLFEEDAGQPTATVSLAVGGGEPSADMVRAVQNLVGGAVLGMKSSSVTVVDQHGKTLSAASDQSIAGKEAQDRKSEVEARIAKTVKQLVDRILTGD